MPNLAKNAIGKNMNNLWIFFLNWPWPNNRLWPIQNWTELREQHAAIQAWAAPLVWLVGVHTCTHVQSSICLSGGHWHHCLPPSDPPSREGWELLYYITSTFYHASIFVYWSYFCTEIRPAFHWNWLEKYVVWLKYHVCSKNTLKIHAYF